MGPRLEASRGETAEWREPQAEGGKEKREVCVCVYERDTVGFNQQQVVCNEITTQSTQIDVM